MSVKVSLKRFRLDEAPDQTPSKRFHAELNHEPGPVHDFESIDIKLGDIIDRLHYHCRNNPDDGIRVVMLDDIEKHGWYRSGHYCGYLWRAVRNDLFTPDAKYNWHIWIYFGRKELRENGLARICQSGMIELMEQGIVYMMPGPEYVCFPEIEQTIKDCINQYCM
jgi:hypothetical protein